MRNHVAALQTAEHQIKDALAALRPQLRRFAYGLSGSLEEADELVQAAYARALARLGQWQAGTRLDSWMYRIIQSIHLNKRQAAKVRGEHYAPLDPDEQMGSDGAREAEAQMTLDAVRRFIWQLPEEQRTVLLLITVEGLSYKETAELLGLPIGTVTSRLARARLAVNALVNTPPAKPQALTQLRNQ